MIDEKLKVARAARRYYDKVIMAKGEKQFRLEDEGPQK